MKTSEILSKIYFDSKNPASYGGVKELYKQAKKIDSRIKLKNVEEWLSGQFTYTLHKQARKHFKRNRIYVKYIDELWEADLIDFQNFASVNNNNKFILIVIDVFSKFVFAFPIKNKKSAEIVIQFKKLFKSRKPAKLRTDKGLEFQNKALRKLCENAGIRFFATENIEIKCAVAERVIGTLKRKMFRYFTKNGTRRYLDILQDMVRSYNNSYHRSIKMKPIEVNFNNESQVFRNMYGTNDKLSIHFNERQKPSLKIGDKVRQKYRLSSLDKSYYPLWTDIVYNINKVISKVTKPQYELSLDGKVFNKKFYPEELQKVLLNKNSLWLVDKVISTRTRRGEKEALVKFKGYPDSYNQWLPSSQIQNL